MGLREVAGFRLEVPQGVLGSHLLTESIEPVAQYSSPHSGLPVTDGRRELQQSVETQQVVLGEPRHCIYEPGFAVWSLHGELSLHDIVEY